MYNNYEYVTIVFSVQCTITKNVLRQCALHTAHYTLHTPHCTLHTVQCAVYNNYECVTTPLRLLVRLHICWPLESPSTLCSVLCVVCSVQCVQYVVCSALCAVCSVQCSVLCVVCSVKCSVCSM